MLDRHLENPKSPKYHVKKYLDGIAEELRNKTVIDFPAGNGVTTHMLKERGAKVDSFDLFPEYFLFEEASCTRADINDKIPVANQHADMLICQEGIEHFSDQLKAFKEFNRVLRKQGRLVVTTPSYSNLSSKLSYLLFESETSKQMPPNEIDDIWMSDKSITPAIYHGHIFLIGLQKLRILGRLSGFKIKDIRYMRMSKGSLLLFPFLYPLILLSSLMRYTRNMKKHKELPQTHKRQVYKEQLLINISPKNLLNHHIFVVFEKDKNLDEVDFRVESLVKPFQQIM